MNQFRELLLDIWREACRHIEITPLDRGHRRVSGPAHPHRADPGPPHRPAAAIAWRPWLSGRCPGQGSATPETNASRGKWRAMLSWCRAGEVLQGRRLATAGQLPAAILPGPVRADVLAGPLALHDDRFGVLLLVARPPGGLRAAARGIDAGAPGAVCRGPGKRSPRGRNGRPARGGRGRQALVAQTPGTRQAGRHDRRHRLRAPRGHGTRRVGLQVRRAGADLRRDRHRARRSSPGRSTTARRRRSGRSSA